MSEPVETHDEANKRLTLEALTPLVEIWSVQISVMERNVAALWRRHKEGFRLHHFATVAANDPAAQHVTVPLIDWVLLRSLSNLTPAPHAVYTVGKDGQLQYIHFPVNSGQGFAPLIDSVYGAVVGIPKSAFSRVEKRSSE